MPIPGFEQLFIPNPYANQPSTETVVANNLQQQPPAQVEDVKTPDTSDQLPTELQYVLTDETVTDGQTINLKQIVNLTNCETDTGNSLIREYPNPTRNVRLNDEWTQFLSSLINSGFCLTSSNYYGLASLFVAFDGNLGEIGNFTDQFQVQVSGNGGLVVNQLPTNLRTQYLNLDQVQRTNSVLILDLEGNDRSLTIGGTTTTIRGSTTVLFKIGL